MVRIDLIPLNCHPSYFGVVCCKIRLLYLIHDDRGGGYEGESLGKILKVNE